MINYVKVTNHLGESLVLELRNPERSGFLVRGIDGLGPYKADININEIASDDGGLFNSARYQSRNIVLDIVFFGEDIEDLRLKSYRYFPVKRKISIIVSTENRLGSIDGYVESNEPNIFSSQEGSKISILCPFPFFKAVMDFSTNFAGNYGLFEFPFSNESLTQPLLIFGRVEEGYIRSIYYSGEEPTGIRLKVESSGSINNFMFFNNITQEFMKIDDTKLESLVTGGISNNDILEINTTKGSKSVTLIRNGVPYNILNSLTVDSTWLQLENGLNLFGYSATTGIEYVNLVVSNDILYGGL